MLISFIYIFGDLCTLSHRFTIGAEIDWFDSQKHLHLATGMVPLPRKAVQKERER
jgi:hypothetical protein